MVPIALTIAGSDSSGGAGIQADLKTFAALRVYGASVLTAITAQNTLGVRAIADLDPSIVTAQIDAVFDDLAVDAVKTGMLSNADVVEAVAGRLKAHPMRRLSVVVDPVMVAASGDVLLRPDAIDSMKRLLLLLASVVTPNAREAEILSGRPVVTPSDQHEAARAIAGLGAKAVLVKGGRLSGEALDVLFDGHQTHEFRAPRVAIGRSHGAGCTLSAAVAAYLARGEALEAAIGKAKSYVTRALQTAPPIGHGARPLNHFADAEDEAGR